MNLERELADALHGTYGSARPDPDLRLHVIAAIEWKQAEMRHAGQGRLRALAGLAAALLVVVTAGALGQFVRPPESPTATGLTRLTTYAGVWLSLDYPSAWQSRADVLSSVTAFWTGTGPADCIPATPEATGPDSHCGRQAPMLPGTLYVTVGPGAGAPIDPSDPAGLPSGGEYTTIAGQAAIFVEHAGPTGTALDWSIAQAKQPRTRLQIHAELADPGVAQMRTKVVAMVASLRFGQKTAPFDASIGNDVATRWMEMERSLPGFGCFSTKVGEVKPAVVTEFATNFDGPTFEVWRLSKPLPVSCEMTIAPARSVGLWKLTLTQSWTADTDHAAGSYVLVFWLDQDVTDTDSWLEGVGGRPDVLGSFPYPSTRV